MTKAEKELRATIKDLDFVADTLLAAARPGAIHEACLQLKQNILALLLALKNNDASLAAVTSMAIVELTNSIEHEANIELLRVVVPQLAKLREPLSLTQLTAFAGTGLKQHVALRKGQAHRRDQARSARAAKASKITAFAEGHRAAGLSKARTAALISGKHPELGSRETIRKLIK